MKTALKNTEGQKKPSPLRGEGKDGGEGGVEMLSLPLTLALSPKGRGEMSFDNSVCSLGRKDDHD